MNRRSLGTIGPGPGQSISRISYRCWSSPSNPADLQVYYCFTLYAVPSSIVSDHRGVLTNSNYYIDTT